MWSSRLEIARAFLEARRRMSWSAEQLRTEHQKHIHTERSDIETSVQFEQQFAARNALGMTMEQARAEAVRELAGHPPAVPGFSWGLSTGTMGGCNLFLTSERERNAWIGTVLGKCLPLRMLAGSDVALVLKHNSRLYTDTSKTRCLRLHHFDASVPVTEWADRICSLSPNILIGPPGVLEQLALSPQFQRHPFRPQLLLAGAEPLFPQDKHFLERYYGVAPRVIYQAKEGFLAAGCSAGGIHLNEDLIYFEALELGRRRLVPVITDFTRTSQHYRRYRLDDVLIAAPAKCSCGQVFAAVSSVEGRANDVMWINGESIFPLEINEMVVQYSPSVERQPDYQMTQLSPDEITFAVEGGTPAGLVKVFASRLHPAKISTGNYQPSRPGEKRRRVRRLFDPHNDWLNRFTVSRNVASGR
jgi:putative adenylate-forming enzyme